MFISLSFSLSHVICQMLSQKNAVIRESSVVLASAASDKQLQEAFLQIEELQKMLENERSEHVQKVKEK